MMKQSGTARGRVLLCSKRMLLLVVGAMMVLAFAGSAFAETSGGGATVTQVRTGTSTTTDL